MSRVNIEGGEISGALIRGPLKNSVTILAGTADQTLDLDMGPMIYVAPTANRNLTLPAFTAAELAAAKGTTFTVVNGAAFTLTVRTSTPTTIGVVPATVGATGTFVCLGDSTLGVGGWSGGL